MTAEATYHVLLVSQWWRWSSYLFVARWLMHASEDDSLHHYNDMYQLWKLETFIWDFEPLQSLKILARLYWHLKMCETFLIAKGTQWSTSTTASDVDLVTSLYCTELSVRARQSTLSYKWVFLTFHILVGSSYYLKLQLWTEAPFP